MKLQISFDLENLERALDIAHQVAPYADIIEIGTVLLFHYGIAAIQQFKGAVGNKPVLVDSKIIDRGKLTVPLLANAGADWITVMAGTSNQVIHTVCTTAQQYKKRVMLDLIDAPSPGQSAMEAKNLGIDALMFHQPYDEQHSLEFLDKWDMVSGNTKLPIFISAKIGRDNIQDIIAVNPSGIIVGKGITDSENPAQEAAFYRELCDK